MGQYLPRHGVAMNRTSRTLFCWFAVAVLWACQSNLTVQEFPAAATPPDIPQLIKELGDADFSVRERATEALKQKPKAIPALRAALRSDDREVRRRSKEIFD